MKGAEVKRARKRLRMSQAELAEAIGMQRNSIARMERDAQPVMRTTELALKYLLLTVEKTKGRK
jgi:transcriptional regulator with XRE-family HTH domain